MRYAATIAALETVVRRAADIDESHVRPVQKGLRRGGDAVRGHHLPGAVDDAFVGGNGGSPFAEMWRKRPGTCELKG
jgi:hypothetical protein